MNATLNHNATRNVYLGNLDPEITVDNIRDDLGRFGDIDQIKLLKDKNIAFVHFLSIAVAIKVVETLPTEPQWHGRRVNFGKDRCAYIRSAQTPRTAQFSGTTPASPGVLSPNFPLEGFGGNPMSPIIAAMSGAGIDAELTRTVYLGNLSEDTKVEDLCNAVRGGLLHNVKYMPEKHIVRISCITFNVDCLLNILPQAFVRCSAFHRPSLSLFLR